MVESIFLNYFWIGPTLWIFTIILNYLLGKHITRLNQDLYVSTDLESEDQKNEKYCLWIFLRILLGVPSIIFFWWFFTRFINLSEGYLLLIGFMLLRWVNAIIRQLSSLLAYYLPRLLKYEGLPDKDTIKYALRFKYIALMADYFGYFLIYLLVTILAQDWFFAGGAIACLITMGKQLINQIRNAGILAKVT